MVVTTEEATPLEKKIIRQVEHYFGDCNLPRDKHLKELMKENEGWVSMEEMLKFKRLADLSKDTKLIIDALKKSKSGLMEIESDEKIRRSPSQPLPENNEETKLKLQAKTAYAKGFDKDATMDMLLDYYTENEPTVINVSMRQYFDKKDKQKHFKGSVFLTFRSVEDCKAFVEAEKKDFNGAELVRKFQKVYLDEKAEEFEAKKKERNDRKGKKKAGKEEEEKKGEEEEAKDEVGLPKGTVVKLTGLGGEITREDIKEKLSTDFEVNIDKESGDIAFITYQKGEAEAKIRFKVENYGKTLMEKLEKAEKIVIKDMEVKPSLLEGEEEDQFLADSLRDLKNQKQKNKNHKRKGGHQDHGGKRFKRK